MVVTHCGQSGLNVLKPVEAEHEPVKEPVPTLPLWGMERAAIIWVNQRRIRNAMKIRALIVSGLKQITARISRLLQPCVTNVRTSSVTILLRQLHFNSLQEITGRWPDNRCFRQRWKWKLCQGFEVPLWSCWPLVSITTRNPCRCHRL